MKTWLIILLVLLGLGAVSAAIWYFLLNHPSLDDMKALQKETIARGQDVFEGVNDSDLSAFAKKITKVDFNKLKSNMAKKVESGSTDENAILAIISKGRGLSVGAKSL